MPQDDDNTVKTTLETLVNHYNQPIHQKTADKQNAAPYFDALLGRPLDASPVTLHCIQQLKECNKEPENIVCQWINGYTSHIRPILMRNGNHIHPNGVPVLEQYEIVLSSLLQGCNEPPPLKQDNEHVALSISTLAKDVSSLTEASSKEDSHALIANLVFPTLLQVMAQSIPFVGDNDVHAKRTCAVTLLSFGHARMDPRFFVNVNDVIASTLSFQDVSLDVGTDWLDWTSVELNGTTWDDPITGIATRTAQQCWNILWKCNGGGDAIEDKVNNDIVKRLVLQQLGWKEMAVAVRAHFFGRDETETTTVSKPVWQYPLVQSREPLPHESICKRPSRVHVALQFLYLLDTQPAMANVLQDVLPMIYALLDSTNKHVAMGAAALLHVYTLVTPETLQAYQDTLLPVLERATTQTREGPAVLLVALAHSRIFLLLPNAKKQRRQVTQQMLTTVWQHCAQQNVQLLLGLLVGGIVPLLQQLADEPNADAMELGRLGLNALLSTLHTFHPSIQGASLMALIHLLLGAYPIMTRHGGVIMSNLLACLGRANQAGMEECTSFEKVAVTTAAVALIVCGDRAAAVLDYLDENANHYEPTLVQHVGSIRKEALRLQEANNAIDESTEALK